MHQNYKQIDEDEKVFKNNFIGSLDLDEIDSPLKVVQQCMERLEKSKFTDASSDEDGVSESYEMKINELEQTLDTVSLDWQSLQNAKECPCSSPFEPFGLKQNCFSCGQIFCIRCIDKRISLPAHSSQDKVPVCRNCYMNLVRSNSIDLCI